MHGSCCSGGSCKCPHHSMKGIGITVIGLAFLLQTLGVLSALVVSYIWPIALLIIGLTKLFGGRCGCCKEGGEAQGNEGCCGGHQ